MIQESSVYVCHGYSSSAAIRPAAIWAWWICSIVANTQPGSGSTAPSLNLVLAASFLVLARATHFLDLVLAAPSLALALLLAANSSASSAASFRAYQSQYKSVSWIPFSISLIK